jgi:hypothetical protein
VLTGGAARGQEVVDVERAALVTGDGSLVTVDGGVWLSTQKTVDVARDLQLLRAENERLKNTPPAPPAALVVVAGVALLFGFGAGLALALSLR